MTDHSQRMCELEKENRRLQKKLQRSEANQIDQEKRNDAKEAMLRGVIQDLQISQAAVQASHEKLQHQAEELETALIELKRTQAQLIQSEKMSSLGQLVAGVAHEINNPVGFVSGNLQYAEQYVQDLVAVIRSYEKHFSHCRPPELEQHLAEIDLEFVLEDLAKLLRSMQVGCSRIHEIVLSLRNFSRLDEADLKPVDIHAGIESTLLILQSRLKPNSAHSAIAIVRDYGDLPDIECYAGQLNQVFMNILSNAIDALEAHAIAAKSDWQPTITIQTEMNRTVKIRIADNGTGIPEEIRSRLFDPFFTTKDIGKGTGLGLSISYQIVTRHKGQLSCRSTLGEGTEFLIEIPAQICTKKAARDRAA